ncbi:MAG TPA: family 10 glycosylhydrolase [Bacilli bacterium]|jgi:uncharacterized lipoprotein YddW (UPF0748 family)|nr:family 10 glycosylhydrolase [Bacilli bacterium]HOE06154.1 family 10 glycosylhydrolase [Bacilli bacterium]HPL54920.1 family 10 glycosylhydrolase [Bacilli bacterium]
MNFKSRFIFILILILGFASGMIISAQEKVLTETNSDKPVTYLGTDETVKIATEYVAKNTDFRAVWVSAYVADVASYRSKTQYQAEITSVLDVMSYYNLNVMIFHVRILNDALYTTSMSPTSKYWKVDTTWDALTWVIEECHKRGIEFHAWMNPYRVSTGAATIDMTSLAKKFPAANPASDVNNMLKGSNVVILNPAKQTVQNFLVNACMEVVRNYDVDAIHFDDYFYTTGIGNQDDADYKASHTTMSLADWRRDNVSNFIHRLSQQIRAYNRQNNKIVQFGISPSGVYRDGNGKVTYNEDGDASSTGSLTRQGGHYGDPLYCDSLRWVNEEWIDYICPQCYHGFETTNSSFHGKVSWWNKVVEKKKVNLYIGIGLYMTGGKYWPGEEEFYHQMLYLNTQKNVNGIAIFSYRHLKEAYVNSASPKGVQVAPILENCWNQKTILPTLAYYDNIVLEKVTDLYIRKNDSGYEIIFPKQEEAKFYAIYRTSEMQLSYSNEELIATIGGSSNEYYHYQDRVEEGNYLYGVRPLSKNNTLGEANFAYSISPYHQVVFKDHNGDLLAIKFVGHRENADAPDLDFIPEGYHFIGWSIPITNIIGDIETQAIIEKGLAQFEITFIGNKGEIIEKKRVFENEEISYPEAPQIMGYTFTGWDKELVYATQEETITALYERNQYRVRFFNGNELLKEVDVFHGDSVSYTDALEKEGYTFLGWDRDLQWITESIDVHAIYEKIKYTIRFLDENKELIKTLEVEAFEEFHLISSPEKEGYRFVGWKVDGEIISNTTLVATRDMDIVASYEVKEINEGKGCNQINLYHVIGLCMVVFVLRKRKYI